MKPNGCNEDGWDLYEEQTRQEFEYYAVRRGYSVVRDADYNFFYAEKRTADAWEMYHQGHVGGRGWSADNKALKLLQEVYDFYGSDMSEDLSERIYKHLEEWN